jgi:hypothetical protein
MGLVKTQVSVNWIPQKYVWHEETNLEAMHGWHVVSFFYILANGRQEVSCQVQMDSSSISKNLEVKPNDIGPMDIFGMLKCWHNYK